MGDTLIFKSEAGDYDSITIVSKDIRYNGLSEGYSGNPQSCWIEYQTIPPGKPRLVGFGGPQGDVYNQDRSFLTATKWDNNKPARIEIQFNGFHGMLPPMDSIKKDKNHGDHFLIQHYCHNCTGLDPTDVIQLIWTPKRGIVQYKTKDHQTWRLIQ
ncbi:MAG: hypothetical protein EP346_12840 [Bacteroidetes bacterium]|nr:MAG: hypothetical protein EP346_12840 [Bacteroidota bacterium]